MNGFLLAIHVLAAVLTVGPVAVAASMFPPAARLVLDAGDDSGKVATARVLHRITRVYAVIGVFVPVFGLATAASMGVLADLWLIVSFILTAVAAVILIAFILPGQVKILGAFDTSSDRVPGSATGSPVRRLAMLTGVFNLLWAVVLVLMIYRPGSTTGVGL